MRSIKTIRGLAAAALASAGISLASATCQAAEQLAAAGTLRAAVARHAAANGVPAAMAMGIVHFESRFNPRAVNGPYTGLTQIHPRTAAGLGYRGTRAGLFLPETNLAYGMKYLGQAYKLAKGNTCGTIMRYQSGHGATRMNSANTAYCARLTAYMKRG